MRCPDGARLATRLWIPSGGGPWPVLLMRQPYGRAIASTVTYAHPRWYAERGFLVAVQDVRGRGDSDGEFRGFAGEAADGAAAVRWARGLPESSGRVGAYGFSYQGLSQLLNSGSGSDLPDGLAPAMAGLDEAAHWAAEGGAHWWGLGLAWGLQLAAEGCRRRGDDAGWWEIRRCLQTGSHPDQGLELLRRHDPEGMALGWFGADPLDAAAWRVHQPAPELLRRPMLLIGGWHDPHLNGVLDLWRRVRRAGGRAGLVVGPWTHLDWHGGLDALQLAFFRRHLLEPATPTAAPADGEDTLPSALAATIEGGIALAAEGDGGWFVPRSDRHGAAAIDQTPDAGIAAHEPPDTLGWRLRSDGRAAISSSEGRLLEETGAGSDDQAETAGRVTLVHDPWRPVPARGGHLGLPPGALDRADLDRRADVACFTSEPLRRERWLVGRPLLQLEVAADQPGFDLCAALSLLPAGQEAQVRQLSCGHRRILGAEALSPASRTVALQPLALRLAPGDRLRLSIAASAWPAIAVNPGDGTMPLGPAGPGHRVITLELNLSGARLRLEPLLSLETGAD